ncbi:hypothetical protein BV20DRAFT_1053224 [Pilatotrama ljubarskyi]|nr:hypothetical protein BV20DRAFT_1053224 [Pilatotrama ljubarskyi]
MYTILEHGRQQASPHNTLNLVADSDAQQPSSDSEGATPELIRAQPSAPYDSSDDSDDSGDSLWSIDLEDLRTDGSMNRSRAGSDDPELKDSAEDEPAPRASRQWEFYPCGSRPYLSNRLAWALMRHTTGNGYIIQCWTEHLHAGVALRFRHSLDALREGDEHGHDLFTEQNQRTSYPNATTLRELVGLCRYLGDRLVGLMCWPELVVPRVPRLVHGIARSCPKLRALGIEDLQCEYFDSCLFPEFFYLAAAVESDRPKEECLVTPESQLHTLILAKRSISPWEDKYHTSGMARALQESLDTTALPPHHLEREPELMNAQAKIEEARDLAHLMVQEFPSLKRAHVDLDHGSLNFRVDADKRFQALSAGGAYLIDLPPLKVLANTSRSESRVVGGRLDVITKGEVFLSPKNTDA